MSSLKSYVNEVLRNTSHIFRPLRRYTKELVVAVLEEGVYLDRVWLSTSHSKEKVLVAAGYDDDGFEVEVTGKWERDASVAPGDVHSRQFKLVDVLVEEL